MRFGENWRHTLFTLIACCVFLLATHSSVASQHNTESVQGEDMGFIVHGMGNALARPGQIDTMCPNGRSRGYRQIYEHSEEGQRHEGESAADYTARMNAGAFKLATLDGTNLCANPEFGPPDTHYHMMTSRDVIVFGIDLDSRDSSSGGPAVPGTCAHDDFRGVDGSVGVDNQMARVVGCDGAGEQYAAADEGGLLPSGESGVSEMMLQGGWAILIALSGVDSTENDDDVQVGLYAGADPIVLSPTKNPIPYATYSADQDPRFRAETRGRIVDGKLTTDPVDVRFHWLVAGLHL